MCSLYLFSTVGTKLDIRWMAAKKTKLTLRAATLELIDLGRDSHNTKLQKRLE